jgi:uroporphyrinogen-III synthase
VKKTVSVELTPENANMFKAYLRSKGIRYHSSECYCNILIQADMTEQEIKSADAFLATI